MLPTLNFFGHFPLKLDMNALVDDPRFIPTSVRAAVSIRNATENPEIGEHAIEAMVCAEPMVAAALLRMANSAAYRRGDAVTEVGQAIFTLGLSQVRMAASHVAMLQLVHGVRPRAAKGAAESLLLHSISISTFAEILARKASYPEAPRVASLGLFHELPAFLFLARANRAPQDFESLADIRGVLERTPLRSYELVMQDLGLPELAVFNHVESALIDRAHAYVSHPNPLQLHPSEDADRTELSGEEVVKAQEQADASFVVLVQGAVPRAHHLDEDVVPSLPAPPASVGAHGSPVIEPAGMLAGLRKAWAGLFR